MNEFKLEDTEKLALVAHLLASDGYDDHSKLERIIEVIMETEEMEVPRH